MINNMKDCPNILFDFQNYLLNVKDYSINTVKAYSSDLIQFFKFIKSYLKINIPVKEFNIFILLQIKSSDIIAFLVYLNFNKENNPYTRQRKIVAIRRFYKWLQIIYPNGDLKYKTIINIPYIKKIERFPKYLSLEESLKIQKIFTIKNSLFPLRNNAIISLFLSTGLRVSELININFIDINFEDNSIKIFGKNGIERKVYFSNYCKEQLSNYIKYEYKKEKSSNAPLFCNKYNDRIGVDGVENICNKAFELLGTKKNGYTTHTLRHTAASIMYIYVTQDIFLLKEFLGHKNISSTEIYTHIDNKTIRDVLENHPLNNYISNSKKIA